MAAKEPTVDEEEAMKRLVRFAFSDDDGDPDLSLLPGFKAALEKATRAAAERAWNEGYKTGHGDGRSDAHGWARRIGDKNPYRQPPKGGDDGE